MTQKSSPKTLLIIIISIIILILLVYYALILIFNNQETPPYNNQDNNQVVEIIDGDTFKTNDGEIIRLLCVDTPEKNQKGYDEATSFLEERLLFSDSEIRLEGNKTDKYGRSLKWVYADDVLINKEIVDLGYGTIFEYDDEDCGLMS